MIKYLLKKESFLSIGEIVWTLAYRYSFDLLPPLPSTVIF